MIDNSEREQPNVRDAEASPKLVQEIAERRADEHFQGRIRRRLKEDAPVLERLKG